MRVNRVFFLLVMGRLLMAAESISTSVEHAQTPWSVRATDHFIFSNAPEKTAQDLNTPAKKIFMNEIKVSGEYGAYNGQVQLSNRYSTDGVQSKNSPVKLEKKDRKSVV